jgi:pyruvate/2-oxoglutarate dehydrogenase complex dihydrolipoamide dehydrogenase (E3) component
MGGGIIGLEMGTVYHALGSEIDVVEMFDQVIPAADKDVVKVFTKRIGKQFNLMLETKVTAVEAKEDGIYVSLWKAKKHQQKHSVTTRCWWLSAACRTVKTARSWQGWRRS